MPTMTELRLGTANAPVAAPRCAALLQLMHDSKLEFLAVQEAGLHLRDRARFRETCKQAGVNVVFGAGEVAQAIFLTTFPVQEVVPKGVTDLHRVAFGVIEGARKMLVGSVYGHVDNAEAREILLREAVEFAASSALPWALLGDFNATVEEPELANLVAAGVCADFDSFFAELLLRRGLLAGGGSMVASGPGIAFLYSVGSFLASRTMIWFGMSFPGRLLRLLGLQVVRALWLIRSPMRPLRLCSRSSGMARLFVQLYSVLQLMMLGDFSLIQRRWSSLRLRT